MSEQDFEQIYRRYFQPVYRFALSLTQDQRQAEEITQETFFKALQSLGKYRGESSLQTWLCSIAKNVFLSERRKKKTESLDSLAERRDEAAGPEEQALAHAESIRLHRLLHQLPEPYKEVFSLRVFAQLSFGEIGALFGKSENWACVVFHRARNKLQQKEDAL
ncbi:MAG: sigma-70 family RNA polymerase sigma factor [Firmicutes bacterium]|nr:sigma-70 family RNA polymerase sigma factor [Bacillota bacterium]